MNNSSLFFIENSKIQEAFLHCSELRKQKESEIEAKIEKDIDELMKKHWLFRPKDRNKARIKVIYRDTYIIPWRHPDYRNYHDDNFIRLFSLFKASEVSHTDYCLLNDKDAEIVYSYIQNKKD